uniref:Uncharacterized protein n=1 Tax=Pavo cristatus TaxID=9049 RepID=A0A8C9FID6_PAVCR
MRPVPCSSDMDFGQSNLFGYIEDLQELTIIERPVRRSLKTPEEIERLTVNEELNDIERALYLLRYFLQHYCETLLTFVFTYGFFSAVILHSLYFLSWSSCCLLLSAILDV